MFPPWKDYGFHHSERERESVCVCVCVCVWSVAQSTLTLHNPRDCSPSVSSVHGISQVRMLEWVAISSSKRSSQPRDQTGCLLCWQANSLMLSHQRRSTTYYYISSNLRHHQCIRHTIICAAKKETLAIKTYPISKWTEAGRYAL